MKYRPALACAVLLIGCADGRAASVGYGNDALPSAEVRAFQRLDARLRYRDARIAYDGRHCAVYEGRTRRGRVQRQALRDERGRRLCTGRP
ncbi:MULTISPECIES: hypothetical protein [unclassified Methylobacterium]|uniref:hypothetical protein n=1 Tax=unclassified Methylobacterium TaxID=2615210 RepID=UPI0036F521FE